MCDFRLKSTDIITRNPGTHSYCPVSFFYTHVHLLTAK